MAMLKNKIILVTGGNGLIGKSIIEEISHNGGVALNLDINIQNNESKSEFFCDVTDSLSVKSVISEILNIYGRIDGLVNNAYPRTKDWGTDFENIELDSLKKNIDYQLTSSIYMCQQVVIQMKKSGGGSIVNIGSIYGVVGNDFSLYKGTSINPPASYSGIKGGVINFTRFLAAKYGNEKIRVNCISPGGVFDYQDQTFVQRYSQKVPLGRMAYAKDISPAVCFFLSENSNYITGQNLIIDGGYTSI